MKRKKFLPLLALLLCVLLAAGGCGTAAADKSLNDSQLLSVGGRVCSRAEGMVFLISQIHIYQNSYGQDIWKVQLENGTFEEYLKSSLRDYIGNFYTVYLMAEASGLTLTDTEKAQVREAGEQFYRSLDASDIQASGLTAETSAEVCREYFLARKMYKAILADSAIVVSNDEARVMHIQQIVLNKDGLSAAELTELRSQASDLLQKARTADFARTAAAGSQSAETTRTVTRSDMEDAAMEKAVFDLKDNEISGLIETDSHIYIVKCISSYDASLTAARKTRLLAEKQDARFRSQRQAYLDEHPAVFNENCWDKISISGYQGKAAASFYEIYAELTGDV